MVIQNKSHGTGKFSLTETSTQLTAVGQTTAVKVEGMENHTFQVLVASINTNVIVEAQGSLDGTNYFPLTLDSTATASYTITTNRVTITANGTYSLVIKNTPLQTIRFNFVSETGGAAATLDVKYRGQS